VLLNRFGGKLWPVVWSILSCRRRDTNRLGQPILRRIRTIKLDTSMARHALVYLLTGTKIRKALLLSHEVTGPKVSQHGPILTKDPSCYLIFQSKVNNRIILGRYIKKVLDKASKNIFYNFIGFLQLTDSPQPIGFTSFPLEAILTQRTFRIIPMVSSSMPSYESPSALIRCTSFDRSRQT